MSLLTDKDILGILEPVTDPALVAKLRDNAEDLAIFMSEYSVVAGASQTATLKAVAEWLLDNCGWDGHGNRLIYFDFKNSKDERQLVNWLANLCNGKMPGEE